MIEWSMSTVSPDSSVRRVNVLVGSSRLTTIPTTLAFAGFGRRRATRSQHEGHEKTDGDDR